MMYHKNTKNKSGMKKERPTMPQHKNGTKGMKYGTGNTKTQKVTMRRKKKKHMEERMKKRNNNILEIWNGQWCKSRLCP
eukprot:8822994-Prorocentrum_lima.AAC.1